MFFLTLLFAAVASLFGTDAGMITDPAPVVYVSDTFDEVPLLPEAAYNDPDLCVAVPVGEGEISNEALAYLVGQGWTGRQDDGMEALYPTGC
jgi:hypothetical protein